MEEEKKLHFISRLNDFYVLCQNGCGSSIFSFESHCIKPMIRKRCIIFIASKTKLTFYLSNVIFLFLFFKINVVTKRLILF